MDLENITIDEVIKILHKTSDENIIIVEREKNSNIMYEFNITTTQAKDVIRHLEKTDLHSGPLTDNDKTKNYPLWVFKKRINLVNCYIKLKIVNYGKNVLVISFHKDDYS